MDAEISSGLLEATELIIEQNKFWALSNSPKLAFNNSYNHI